ncbi:Glycoprotein 3-alpha-L-fucosyltransferase A [Echinococcus granulosus]|uniref:Fucosyltransferase n=1 Tax=Echinococcus granulosus TaxID=6210 RepID=A0A068WS94_ECHGR|nr:Glycoprotein 3-alpha-L-fucosyltransferase A [Echinococcus granulosus]CDS21311.1 glycoprotein 3 alpha L fucosyltransferase [Echinococcus granulosus]
MNKSAFSSSLACWLISNFLILVILWSSLPDKSPSVEELFSNIRNFFVFQDQLYPYYHVIEQLEWISAFSHNESDLSIVKPPKIFYDGHLLYHVTESQGCRYKCNFTNYLYDLGVGDIAVFSEPFYAVDVEYLRQNGVLIAFESVESPVHMRELTQIQMQQVDIFITYLPWSQVPYMYPMFLRKTNRGKKFTSSEVAALLAKNSTHLLPLNHRKRRKLIAWLVSNGSPKNNRDSFAYLISNFISVDVYGGMGRETPPGRDPLQWISEHYKFYLAFENSNCRYYITEKVTVNALRNGMVPIVLGAYKEDYESVLPPYSYINVDDFKSISELVQYLLYLDRNDTAYAEYFAWKEYGDIYIEKRLDCRLCGFMHHLNAGLVKLGNYSPSRFMDPWSLCFYRELLPLE